MRVVAARSYLYPALPGAHQYKGGEKAPKNCEIAAAAHMCQQWVDNLHTCYNNVFILKIDPDHKHHIGENTTNITDVSL